MLHYCTENLSRFFHISRYLFSFIFITVTTKKKKKTHTLRSQTILFCWLYWLMLCFTAVHFVYYYNAVRAKNLQSFVCFLSKLGHWAHAFRLNPFDFPVLYSAWCLSVYLYKKKKTIFKLQCYYHNNDIHTPLLRLFQRISLQII